MTTDANGKVQVVDQVWQKDGLFGVEFPIGDQVYLPLEVTPEGRVILRGKPGQTFKICCRGCSLPMNNRMFVFIDGGNVMTKHLDPNRDAEFYKAIMADPCFNVPEKGKSFTIPGWMIGKFLPGTGRGVEFADFEFTLPESDATGGDVNPYLGTIVLAYCKMEGDAADPILAAAKAGKVDRSQRVVRGTEYVEPDVASPDVSLDEFDSTSAVKPTETKLATGVGSGSSTDKKGQIHTGAVDLKPMGSIKIEVLLQQE